MTLWVSNKELVYKEFLPLQREEPRDAVLAGVTERVELDKMGLR
jgi:hypothetical protein